MPTHKLLRSLIVTVGLLAAGCQHPDGSVDWGNTLLLGAGVGAATALVAGAASDSGPRYDRGYGRGYDRRGYGRGYVQNGPAYGYGSGYGGSRYYGAPAGSYGRW